MDLNQTPEQFASRQVKGFLRNLADGMTMAGAVRGVVLDTLKWRRERFIASKGRSPISPEMEQSLRSRIKELERECDRLKQENAEHIARNHEHLHTIAGLREAPKRITDEMKALIQTIAKQRDDAKKELKQEQVGHGVTTIELEQAKANIAEKQTEVMKFAGDLVKEEEKHRLANEMAAELKRQLDQLKADYTKLSALHQDVAKQRDSLLQTKAELIAEGKRVVAERDEAQSEMSFYKGEHGTAVIRLKETQTKLDTAQDRIKELEAACAQREQALDAAIKELEAACAQREQALDAAIKERDRYKAELVGADKRLAAIHAAFHKA